jgi:hypothetical protein
MGINMLEDNELGALASSRLGNKTFIDDDGYANLSFRGKKYHEGKRNDADRDNVNRDWQLDSIKSSDCEYLKQKQNEWDNIITSELSKNPSADRVKKVIGAMNDKVANVKTLIFKNKCDEKKAKAEKDAEEKKNVEILSQISKDMPVIPQDIPVKGSNTTKYVIIGVGVLVLGIVAMIILKKK